jgi:molybdenum cofactor biosynthesis protein B
MSTTVEQHRHASPQHITCAVLTVSDTRTLENDLGGKLICDLLTAAGHTVSERAIVPDDPSRMRPLILAWVARPDIGAILLTGGTGICERDQTFETVSGLFTKVLPGYGEIFRMLSFNEIGPAAMLSRAIGGVIEKTILLTMPGSPHAVQLAMEKLIVPELKHLIRETTK